MLAMCIYEKGMHVLCVYNHVMWMLLQVCMCIYNYVYNRNIDTVSGISGLWYDMFQYYLHCCISKRPAQAPRAITKVQIQLARLVFCNLITEQF